jgi:hypothetical protein
MSAPQSRVTLRFEIQSVDPGRPTISVVPEAEDLSSALEEILKEHYPGAAVTIRRAEGIPGVRELQELLLHVDWHLLKTTTETAVASFATTEFLKLMKEKLRNVFTKPIPSESVPPIPEPASSSAGRSPKAGSPRMKRKKKSPKSRKSRPTSPRSKKPKRSRSRSPRRNR